jgi:hypothetical protein
MRWIFFTLLLSTFSFCATREAISFSDRHAEAFWHWVPGSTSTSLGDLEPTLHRKVKLIIDQLEAEGWSVDVVTTWRSPLRQALLYGYGVVRHWAGLGPASASGPHTSCHTQRDSDGNPSALAVDLRLGTVASLSRHAAFYHRLGALAAIQELRWGGRWKQSNSMWRDFNLGWDPGHLEDSSCRLTH